MQKKFLKIFSIILVIVLSVCSFAFANTNTLYKNINKTIYNEINNYSLDNDNELNFKISQEGQKSSEVIKNGNYKIAMFCNLNLVIDIESSSQENGANVLIREWQEENNLSKQFKIQYDETDGYYIITNIDSGKLLTVKDGENRVVQYEANGTDSQKWQIINNLNGSYSIVSKLNGLYLDIQNGNISNGENVQVYENNGTIAQQFTFIEIKNPEKIIEDGIYRIAMFSNSNLSIDIDSGLKTNGANVLISDWNRDQKLKQFYIKYDETDGYYTITNINTGKLLDAQNGGRLNGTNVWQFEENKTNSQKWKIIKNSNGSYSIISKLSGLYLDVQNGNITNGGNIQLFQNNGTISQQFEFLKIILPEKTIEDGTYRIAMFSNSNLDIDISSELKNNGANVLIEDYKEDKLSNRFNLKFDETDGYYTITNVNSSKLLDAQGGGTTSGTNVWQYEENNTDSQKWQIIKNDNGSYSIVSKLSDLYIDVNNGNISSGENIQLYEGNNTIAQQFAFVKLKDQIEKPIESGFYELASAIDKNKLFDVQSNISDENVPIQLMDLSGLLQQRFKITYNNNYYIITSVYSDKVLAIDENNKLILRSENGDIQEKWKIKLFDNDKYSFTSLANNYCIDVPLGIASNGVNLQVYESNNSISQRFYIIDRNPMQGTQSVEDGTYKIISPIDNKKTLDVTDGLNENGVKIQIWDNDAYEQKKFEIIYVGEGYYKIKSKLSNKVLTVESTLPNLNSNITQEDDYDLDTQKWIIKDVGNGLYNIISKCENLYLTIQDTPQNGEKIQLQRKKEYPTQTQSFILLNEEPKNNVSIIEDGIYQIKTKGNLTLDVNGGSCDNGANIQIWASDKLPQKKFRVTRIGNTNYYKIVAIHSAKAIDVQNGGIDISTNVQQYEQNETDSQYWYFKDCGNGYYNIISKLNGLCLDVDNGAINTNGTNVQLYYLNDSDAQQFRLEHTNIIEYGIYEIETKLNSNMVVDIAGGSTSEGANVQLWNADNVGQQRFALEPQYNDDIYMIRATNSNKMLTVDTNTNNVYQADCKWTDNQRWKLQEVGNGYFKLISLYNSCVLDVQNGNAVNGQNIQVYQDNGTDSQKFRFVTGFRKFYEQGTYGTSGKRQSGQGGYDLTYYKIGKGSKHLFTTFSIHGFEDYYWKDGSELTYMANQFKDYLYNNLPENLINEWTIYIFPNLNPDGQYDGWTNDGPGRTTVYSNAPNHQGIDMNRGFSAGFQRKTNARNYTGTAPFQAPEAAQLRDFILGHLGSSNVLIDVHGWLNETIGDNGIGSYYRSEFGISNHIGSYGNGYLVNWARSLGNTRSMLLELPGVSNHSQVVNWDYAGKFNRATMRLLNDF